MESEVKYDVYLDILLMVSIYVINYTSVDPKYIFGIQRHSLLEGTRIPSGQPGLEITMPHLGQETTTLRCIHSTLTYMMIRQNKLNRRSVGGGGSLLDSPGLACTHLDSLDIAWTHLNLLGFF